MRNSSLVEWSCAENVPGLKLATEAVGSRFIWNGRGAFSGQRSQCVSYGGVLRSENAGMSSDNPGENPGHRKPKVSYATLIDVGLVGPKA